MEQAVKDYILGALKSSNVPALSRALNISNEDIYSVIEDAAIERIYEGESQAAIAEALGMTPGRISQLLSRNDEVIKRSANARAASAEAWLDKGMAVLEGALHDPSYQGQGTDAGAARAIAQECARRAAIRNPAFRERQGLEVSGPAGAPIKTINAAVDAATAAKLYKDYLG